MMSERVIGTWDWDLRRDLLLFDSASAGYFSFPLGDVAGGVAPAVVLERMHEDDGYRIEALIRASIESGTPYASTFRLRRPEGGYRWIFGRGECQRDARGEPLRFPGINVDLSTGFMAREAATGLPDAMADLLIAAREVGSSLGDRAITCALDLALHRLATGPAARWSN
jgi:hypothetical protein